MLHTLLVAATLVQLKKWKVALDRKSLTCTIRQIAIGAKERVKEGQLQTSKVRNEDGQPWNDDVFQWRWAGVSAKLEINVGIWWYIYIKRCEWFFIRNDLFELAERGPKSQSRNADLVWHFASNRLAKLPNNSGFNAIYSGNISCSPYGIRPVSADWEIPQDAVQPNDAIKHSYNLWCRRRNPSARSKLLYRFHHRI